MSEYKGGVDGRTVSKVYNAQGDLVAESDAPNHWWIFNRQEPLDFISKHVPGGDTEKARIYIAQGWEIYWA